MQQDAIKAGVLWKEGETTGFRWIWKERYFTLSDGPVLTFFTSDADRAAGEEPLGSSLLQGGVLSNTKSARSGRYAFRLNLLVTPYRRGKTEKGGSRERIACLARKSVHVPAQAGHKNV